MPQPRDYLLVTIIDVGGIRHTAEVQAGSLFGAATGEAIAEADQVVVAVCRDSSLSATVVSVRLIGRRSLAAANLLRTEH
jgi:hypothetical protein